jgi:hypothetical protein
MIDRSSFGPELRRAREARGLTLEEIAETTKVNVALYRGLENNDLSRWPSGLFRRAFVRSYAEAVGLDPEETCRRFVRLFPEDGDVVPEMHAVPPPASTTSPGSSDDAPRLVLAAVPPPARSGPPAWKRVAAPLVDVGLAALLGWGAGALAALLAGPGWFWTAAAATVGVVHVAVVAMLGAPLGTRWLLAQPERPRPTAETPQPSRRMGGERPVLVASRHHVPRPAAPGRAAAGRRGRR